ncbi:endonuclease/exonuclease/phosphatase family protein [Halogranum amylolyticum]|uniref:endonuclease/exonuclease/phosphatase family protein n=1 Tax=Halogranum amylolyticum TaxID=660520 RepID=UPI001FCDCE11|nr:endonuclease/exonuclease/phosphatase family protein [Halogranum amylolyticum]
MPHTLSRRRVLQTLGATATASGLIGTVSGRGRSSTARFSAFNVRDLTTEQVQTTGDEQATAAARVIQEVRPDVLVVNELTNNLQEGTATDRPNVDAFVDNYLSVPQREGLQGIDYPYTLQPDSNTGVLPETDYDFNKDGTAGERPGDAYGFGFYPGQYAFAILSRYPIERDGIRSFQEFNWADMPDSRIPLAGDDDVQTEPSDAMYLTEDEADVYRLSSKTHIDVPVEIDGTTVHGLFAHPTPPVFDGVNNFNGRWNADEIRFFADYVAGAEYIYDDSGVAGGLDDDASYVLLGDMNAGPEADRPLDPATTYLLENDDFDTRRLPTSPGGAQRGNPEATATFGGGSQVDWVLPSPELSLRASSVVWPGSDASKRGLGEDVRTASDHRLVWADVATR